MKIERHKPAYTKARKTRKHKARKGFLLVEVLISIGILVLATTTGITLLIIGHRAISINAHSLEASWLAKEGANAFRGLRDTNWLRFSYDKKNCWDSTNNDCAAPTHMLTGDWYRLTASRTDAPQIELTLTELDLTDGAGASAEEQFYRLYYVDPDPLDGIVEQNVEHQPFPPPKPLPDGVTESIFYRSIEIISGTDLDPTTIEAECKVQWREGARTMEIRAPITLRNYKL